jgi:basic amino acid/polyamine antiporter, APA family
LYLKDTTSMASDGHNIQSGAPAPHVSVTYVVFLAVAMVVGAGIFKSPAAVADSAGSVWAVYAVWIAGGLLSLMGALCYAELSTAYPSAGGDYHFLSSAYGKSVGFAFAWARFAVINTGSIALLGFVIGDYLNRVWDLGPGGPSLYAFASVVIMTAFNLRGAKGGKAADYAITVLEVGGLALLAAAAAWLTLQGTPPATAGGDKPPTPGGIGYALVFVMLAFGGWTELCTLSAEVRDKRMGMVKALVWSVVVITALYVMTTWGLLRGLGLTGLAQSAAPAADLMARAFGPEAGVVLALAVAAAAITSINATIIVGARTTYAAARDRKALRWVGHWDGDNGPRRAILVQGAVSIALVALGAVYQGFSTLVDYTAPVYWAFLCLSGLSVIVLRHKWPRAERPFQVPLYPVLPIVFAVSGVAMLWSSLAYVREGALFGLAVVAVGMLVGWWAKAGADQG